MTTARKTVLQLRNAFRRELNAVHDDGESRIIRDNGGALAVLLPCLDDGTVDHDLVDEHNRAAAELGV